MGVTLMRNIVKWTLALSVSFVGTFSFGMVKIQELPKRKYQLKMKTNSNNFIKDKFLFYRKKASLLDSEMETKSKLASYYEDYSSKSEDICNNSITKELDNSYIDGRRNIISITTDSDLRKDWDTFSDVCRRVIDEESTDRIKMLFDRVKEQREIFENDKNRKYGWTIYSLHLQSFISDDRKEAFEFLVKEDPFRVNNYIASTQTYEKTSIMEWLKQAHPKDEHEKIESFIDVCKKYGCKTVEEIQKEMQQDQMIDLKLNV